MALLRDVLRFYERLLRQSFDRFLVRFHRPIDLRPDGGIVCHACKGHAPWPCPVYVNARRQLAEDA